MHCPLKCGQGITIKSLPQHMASLCPRRVVACQYCEEEIALDTKEDHEQSCPKRPVSCMYCHKQTLMQKDLKSHLEKCSHKPENCKLSPLGCNYSVWMPLRWGPDHWWCCTGSYYILSDHRIVWITIGNEGWCRGTWSQVVVTHGYDNQTYRH